MKNTTEILKLLVEAIFTYKNHPSKNALGVTTPFLFRQVSLTDIEEALRDVSATFLLVCFLSLKGSTCKTGKCFILFYFEKFLLFSRKSKFRILDIKISWNHQMPKYKTRNTFY